MYILGLSSYYHDSAAALLKDGVIVAAIQEERLSRIKNDPSFPTRAIEQCLKIAGISINEVEYIVYYEKPFWKFERIMDTIMSNVPFSFSMFIKAVPLWIKNRLWIGPEIRKKLAYKGKILFGSHHESHAAAAYYTSGFDHAAILTIDGVGEFASTMIAIGDQHSIKVLSEQHFPHSLGLLYAAFTQYCGFKVNSGEYKLMGLAPYGKPSFKKLIYDRLIQQHEDGSYHIEMKYFKYEQGKRMVGPEFETLFGKSARKPESAMEEHYQDVAASIQEVIEEIVINLCKRIKETTKVNKIVFAGGVALNCKLNQKIVEANLFEDHYFYANPGDAGSALGAAYQVWHQYLNNELIADQPEYNCYLGNEYKEEEIIFNLNKYKVVYTQPENMDELVAKSISEGKIIGWYNGKIEFGPRALGNRSILADPRTAEMKDILNEKIKLREAFRPFAPVVLKDKASLYFDLYNCRYDQMMVTAQAKVGTETLMPAVIHNDGTARIQTVDQSTNDDLYKVMLKFFQLTGCPALINTSFNVRGEPIVESPEDALRAFLYTDIDVLVFNNKFVVTKGHDLTETKKLIPEKKYAAD